MPDCKIAVVGAGPLGLSLALALVKKGYRVRLYDARKAAQAHDDKRVLALSHGSRQLLGLLGAWPTSGATSIETIHISQRGAFGRTTIHHSDYDLPALGYVLPAKLLMQSLSQRAATMGIEIVFDAKVTAVRPNSDSVSLALENADGLMDSASAQLAACCEGAIGDSNDTGTVQRDYDQHALLCRVTPMLPHRNIAYERFTPDGPIALLPLGSDYAVVWTVSPERLKTLQALNDSELLFALQTAFGQRVHLTSLTNRASYPLGLSFRKRPVAERTVWLGNAAQTLHPVAGQGFNLALRDAWELAEVLTNAPDPGHADVLQRYVRQRQPDRIGAIGFTDLLVRLFSSDNVALTHTRGAGLLALDVVAPLRHFVAKRMLFGARGWP